MIRIIFSDFIIRSQDIDKARNCFEYTLKQTYKQMPDIKASFYMF